jgi:hypothetical protein
LNEIFHSYKIISKEEFEKNEMLANFFIEELPKSNKDE